MSVQTGIYYFDNTEVSRLEVEHLPDLVYSVT